MSDRLARRDDTPRVLKVTLEPAQLLTLNSAPPQLVPAPGVGWMLVPGFAVFTFHPGTVGYSNINQFARIAWSPSKAAGDFYMGVVLAETQKTISLANVVDDLPQAVWAPELENLPLSLRAAAGDPQDGDGTLDVTLTYTIVDVT